MIETTDQRIAVFYKLFEYGAVVVATGVARSDELNAVFNSAEPDWQADGLVVCLADLLDEVAP